MSPVAEEVPISDEQDVPINPPTSRNMLGVIAELVNPGGAAGVDPQEVQRQFDATLPPREREKIRSRAAQTQRSRALPSFRLEAEIKANAAQRARLLDVRSRIQRQLQTGEGATSYKLDPQFRAMTERRLNAITTGLHELDMKDSAATSALEFEQQFSSAPSGDDEIALEFQRRYGIQQKNAQSTRRQRRGDMRAELNRARTALKSVEADGAPQRPSPLGPAPRRSDAEFQKDHLTFGGDFLRPGHDERKNTEAFGDATAAFQKQAEKFQKANPIYQDYIRLKARESVLSKRFEQLGGFMDDPDIQAEVNLEMEAIERSDAETLGQTIAEKVGQPQYTPEQAMAILSHPDLAPGTTIEDLRAIGVIR